MSGPSQVLAAKMVRHFANHPDPADRVRIAAAIRAEPGAAVLGEDTLRRLTEKLAAELGGAGPLTELLAAADVTDVLVNGEEVWVDRGAGPVRCPIDLGGVDQVRRLAQRLASSGGRRLDNSCPFADVQLPDGTRLHAVLPPIALNGPYLSFRTFRRNGFSVESLVKSGTLTAEAADLLRHVVLARLPYLVTGGTGSGKTTLVSALLALVPADERIVVVEDSAELRPDHPHVVALQARVPNVEGAGKVTLRDLVRQALRMRPDRLVVGECRGAEVVDLLGALNTGHEGGAATLHANSSTDVPARLEALGLMGGVPRQALHAQLAAALRVVVHLRRTSTGRVVEEVCLLTADDRYLVAAVPAWSLARGVGPAGPALATLFESRGVPVPTALKTPAIVVTAVNRAAS